MVLVTTGALEPWVVAGAPEVAAFWCCWVKARTPPPIQHNKMHINELSMEEMGLCRNMRTATVSFPSLQCLLHLHAPKNVLLSFPLPVGEAALRVMAVLLGMRYATDSDAVFFLRGRAQCSWLKERGWSFLETVDLSVGCICDHSHRHQQLPLSDEHCHKKEATLGS